MKNTLKIIVCSATIIAFLSSCGNAIPEKKEVDLSPPSYATKKVDPAELERQTKLQIENSKKVAQDDKQISKTPNNEKKEIKTEKIETQEIKDLRNTLETLKVLVQRQESGEIEQRANETSEEDKASMIRDGFAKNPRGVEWFTFETDIESLLSSYGDRSPYQDILYKEFYASYRDVNATMSGDFNINAALQWLKDKISSTEKKIRDLGFQP